MDILYWVWVNWKEINYIIAVLKKKKVLWMKKIYIVIGINYLKNYGSIRRGINHFNFHIYIYIYIYIITISIR